MLARKPGFTVIAVITLALGIGANTAIFSVVNGVLLRPLPYREPERLVRIYSEFTNLDLRKFWISPPEFVDIQKEAKSWESIGAWAAGGANVEAKNGEPMRVTSTAVTRSLMETLGVQPRLGRNFTPEEDRAGGPKAAIISSSLWQRAYGGATDIIGKEIRVNAQTYEIVGVMPEGYRFPPGINDPVDLWVSFQFDPANPGFRGNHFLYVIGRLNPGVTIEQAQSELDALQTNWANEKRSPHLLNPTSHPVLMFRLHEDVVGTSRRAVLMLLGAVAFVLLIACANVASLLLARAEARHREFAVRLSLGAGRLRMLRQFLAEGLVLVFSGAVCGVLLAYFGLNLIVAAAPDSVPRTGEIKIDLLVLAFTLGVSIIAVFMFALAPMLQLSEDNLAKWLHGASLRTTGKGNSLLRKVLVVSEIALAVVLVVGSGLMIRAFWKLRTVDLGINPQQVLSFTITLPQTAYDVPAQLHFSQTLQTKLAALPGVKSAAMTAGGLPPLRPINANSTNIEGFVPTPDEPFQIVDYWNVVSEDYFKAMGIRTMEGRTFEVSDRSEKAQRVVVVNRAMAERFWHGNALGKRLNTGITKDPIWFTVVGVVENAKNIGMDKPAGTELYFPEEQVNTLFGGNNQQTFVIRTEGDPARAASMVRGAIHELDAALPVYGLQTMEEVVGDSLVRPRFLSLLLGLFSVIALLLAAVGIYGVMAYSVAQRTQEIGVRMALGAQAADVLKLVIKQGMTLTSIGVVVGLIAAFVLTRLIEGLLFGIGARDPLSFISVTLLLSLVAFLACYIPARRATKIDPLVAIRYE
jgi:putative ABC transport system permease protein